MEKSIREVLANHPVLGALPVEVREALAQGARSRRVRRGESLWRPHEPATEFVFVTKGLVGVSVPCGPRREVLLGIAAVGDGVGEAASLLCERRQDHAFAFSSAAGVSCIDGAEIIARCESEGGCAMRYLRHLAARHRAADLRLASLTHSSETRLAAIVLALTVRFGEKLDDGTTVIPHRITRANLASMVGTTVETTIRTLSRWTRDGLLTPSDGTLVINDLSSLARIADVSPEAVPALAELTRFV